MSGDSLVVCAGGVLGVVGVPTGSASVTGGLCASVVSVWTLDVSSESLVVPEFRSRTSLCLLTAGCVTAFVTAGVAAGVAAGVVAGGVTATGRGWDIETLGGWAVGAGAAAADAAVGFAARISNLGPRSSVFCTAADDEYPGIFMKSTCSALILFFLVSRANFGDRRSFRMAFLLSPLMILVNDGFVGTSDVLSISAMYKTTGKNTMVLLTTICPTKVKQDDST